MESCQKKKLGFMNHPRKRRAIKKRKKKRRKMDQIRIIIKKRKKGQKIRISQPVKANKIKKKAAKQRSQYKKINLAQHQNLLRIINQPIKIANLNRKEKIKKEMLKGRIKMMRMLDKCG